MLALDTFKIVIPILNNNEMMREDSKIAFSTCDGLNVTIPNSLAVISYEFFDIFIYILRE